MSSEGGSYLKYMVIGCFGTLLVLIVSGLAIVVGGKYALDYAIEEFADENPTAFSESTLGPEESAILEKKFNSFFNGEGGDLTKNSLAMNSDEINHLVANDPEFSDITGIFLIRIFHSILFVSRIPVEPFTLVKYTRPSKLREKPFLRT